MKILINSLHPNNDIQLTLHIVLCLIKVKSNTIELTVHTSCYCILDLLCVILYIQKLLLPFYRVVSGNCTKRCCIKRIEWSKKFFNKPCFKFGPRFSSERSGSRSGLSSRRFWTILCFIQRTTFARSLKLTKIFGHTDVLWKIVHEDAC